MARALVPSRPSPTAALRRCDATPPRPAPRLAAPLAVPSCKRHSPPHPLAVNSWCARLYSGTNENCHLFLPCPLPGDCYLRVRVAAAPFFPTVLHTDSVVGDCERLKRASQRNCKTAVKAGLSSARRVLTVAALRSGIQFHALPHALLSLKKRVADTVVVFNK